MIYDKKGATAERAKNKLSTIQSYFDKDKIGKEWYNYVIELQQQQYQEWPEPPREACITDEERIAYKRYVRG